MPWSGARANASVKLLPKSLPWRITAAYAVGASLWILLSDHLLGALGLSAAEMEWVGTGKGLAFVAVTTALLFGVTRRSDRRREEAAEAERQNRLRWEFALQAAEDGIWDWEMATGRVYFSSRCQAMLGLGGVEALGQIGQWWERVHPGDWVAVNRGVERHLAGESGAWVSEHRVRAHGGDYVWILARGKVVERGPAGEPRRMLGVVSDVTQRRLVEERLDAALAFSHTVVQSSPVGLMACRQDGTILTVNPAAAAIFGLDETRLLSRHLGEIEALRAGGFDRVAEQAVADGRATAHTAEIGTGKGRRRLAARFVPFRHHGEARVLAVWQDETEKHDALRELQLTRAAVQAAPEGWVITDAHGRIEWVNPAFTRLTGYKFEEVVGRNPRLLRSGSHPQEFYADLWQTIRRGDVWEGDIVNRRKDGMLYHEHTVIAPVRTEAGEITHFVAMKQDITAERDLEQRLARSQRLESIGMLASGIAHDLNNVLAPIMLSVGMLRKKVPDPALQPALDVVAQSAQRGAGIVRQVLAFARGGEGERGEISARQLLRDVAGLIEETFPRSITVHVKIAGNLGLLCGDLTQLHQVLLNLAVNARDAMPRGGQLSLEAENAEIDEEHARRQPGLQPGPHVVFRVVDSGTGIPPDLLDRIFDPFFTTKPRGQGTGLGLSTVHGIVRAHGGAVEVASEIGVGTVFSVLLPRLDKAADAAVEERPAPFGAGGGRRVLVVDDEPAILDVATAVLRRHGFDVRVARDGVEGLAIFGTAAPWDAVIVDRMMPRMDGLEFAVALRRHAPEVPVILMSGLLHEPMAGETAPPDLAALGVRAVLEKPFGEEELMRTLRAGMLAAVKE